jgi:hypothetical protein
MHVLSLWAFVVCFKVTFIFKNFDVLETSDYIFQAFSTILPYYILYYILYLCIFQLVKFEILSLKYGFEVYLFF